MLRHMSSPQVVIIPRNSIVAMAQHILEYFNTLFSGTEQLFNISLHVNSSCLGLWSDIYVPYGWILTWPSGWNT